MKKEESKKEEKVEEKSEMSMQEFLARPETDKLARESTMRFIEVVKYNWFNEDEIWKESRVLRQMYADVKNDFLKALYILSALGYIKGKMRGKVKKSMFKVNSEKMLNLPKTTSIGGKKKSTIITEL